jgi:imidazolonepropionase
VLVVDGLIREIGPSRRIENLVLARRADVIDASGCVVMPGFVDCCTQLVSGPARLVDYEMHIAGASDLEIAQAGGGAMGMAHSIQELSFRALEALAVRTLEDAVRHGTTAIEVRSGLGLTEVGETNLRVHSSLQKYPVSVVSTLLCARPAPGYEDQPDHYLDWLCSHLLPMVKRRKLVEFAAIRFEPGGLNDEQARRYLTASRELGFALRIEVGTEAEAPAISQAVEFGASSVDHLVHPSEQDMARLALSDTVATLLPGPVFYRGAGRYPAARRLIDRGVAVALASGYNPQISPSQSVQMIMALACGSMGMTPAEAITAVTINAAHAVRRASGIGSLEAGKRADLLILSVSDYREIPYHFGVNLVDLTMASGEILARRSEVRWPAN